jgi:uncharacterized membrane protein
MSQDNIIKKVRKSKKGGEQIPHRFVAFIDDENLNLSRQDLTDKDIPDLIRFLRQYPTITSLNLSLNNIGDQGLADFAERNQTVVHVNFAGNIISDGGVALFAYKNMVVEQVNFSHNRITEDGISNFMQINEICHTTQFSKVKLH